MTGGERVAATPVPLKRRVRCCWEKNTEHYNKVGEIVGLKDRTTGQVLIAFDDNTSGLLYEHEWQAAR